MSSFMFLVLPAVLLGPYLKDVGLPSIIGYAPELAAIAACAIIVAKIAKSGIGNAGVGTWVMLGLLFLHITFGLIANDIRAGSIIVGARMYFRAVPFFILALVVFPKPDDLRKQYFILLGLSLMQAPVAIYQKLSTQRQAALEGYVSYTGDVVRGTIGNSGFLTVFLIMIATTVVVLYSRKRLSIRMCALLLLAILIPTFLNETKITIFLIPLAIIIPMFAGAKEGRLKKGITAIALLSMFLAVFIPAYDSYMVPRRGEGLIDFLTKEGRVEGYLVKNAQVGSTGPVGRVDSIVIPLKVLGRDPVKFTLGLGIGSVTESTFGEHYEGKYYSRYGNLKGPTVSRLLWETGWLGVVLVFGLLWLIFSKARKIASEENIYGMLAQSYLAVIPIVALSMFYGDLVHSAAFGIVFWYFAGVVVAATGNYKQRIAESARVDVADREFPAAVPPSA